MIMTTSKLRENIYKVLDRVLKTGVAVEIKRNGKILRIVAPEGSRKLANIKKHDVLKDDPQKIVSMDWSREWRA